MTCVTKLLPLVFVAYLTASPFAVADDTISVARPGGFHFDRAISRQVLENYLSRSIVMEGLLDGPGNLEDNIRMLRSIGAKYVGRALCLWNAENDFSNDLQRARAAVPKVRAADPDIVLEACVFETVTPKINQIAIPAWVFTAFDLPVETRNFRFNDIIYPEGQRRMMGPHAQVPDESRMETQMWFYYQAVSYIDIGCEAIHFGQVEIMNRNDPDNWVRNTDTNGWLEMPGSRTAVSPDTRWYFANNPSPAAPTGLGDEVAIRAVWAADTGQLSMFRPAYGR